MLSSPRRIGLNGAAAVALSGLAFALCSPALAQTNGDDGTRAVRIIGAPPPTSAPDNAAPLLTPAAPANPSPTLTPAAPDAANPPVLTPASPGPPLLTPAAPSPSAAAPDNPAAVAPPASNLANVPNDADAGAPPARQDVEALSSAIKVPNAAGLAMQIRPGSDIAVGSEVSFQVSSKKAGYLILIDVDASGKLVQIYPNPMSLMAPSGIRENLNYIRPGKPLQIPDRLSPFAGFEFVASPPAGTAMVLALLSDRPVQLVDLPDVPSSLLRSTSMVDYLTKIANELRIPNSGGKNQLEEAHWSFDVKFYAIR
jgi:Domain of unknown function (DUF4384)